MNDSQDVLGRVPGWYAAQCNEEWEHEWGVKIANALQPRVDRHRRPGGDGPGRTRVFPPRRQPQPL
ncbi:Imm53 family immunity protein [Streptomyces canus]|uniref:Imm53 family immunity protein n=1 Tax=Streptomyces canus TaxID=58343 RepID=UPI003F6BC14B